MSTSARFPEPDADQEPAADPASRGLEHDAKKSARVLDDIMLYPIETDHVRTLPAMLLDAEDAGVMIVTPMRPASGR